MEEEKSAYNGYPIRLTLDNVFEMQMQSDLDKFRLEHPWLCQVKVCDKPLGKVIIVSTTIDENELQHPPFTSCWDDGDDNRLNRFFIPSDHL